MNLTTGTTLQGGKYILHQALGPSQLSLTFKATQSALNQAVVIKTLKSDASVLVDLAVRKQQFTEKMRLFSQCHHPALVKILDGFEEGQLPFVVTDYVAGQSLVEVVKQRGALSESQALQFLRQASSALSQLHRGGVIHGDVKPANLIRPLGAEVVVLVDLGLEGAIAPEIAGSGVPSYAAPEQFSPQSPWTAATDIYALAATLYFLVTGHAPIAANLRNQMALASPRQLQPHLNPAIEAAILSGLELNPGSRPQTISAWLALLPDPLALPSVPLAGNNHSSSNPAPAPAPPVSSNGNGAVRQPMEPTQVIAPAAGQGHATHPRPAQQRPDLESETRLTTPPVPQGSRRLPKVLLMIGMISAAIGLGAGLALRLGSATGIGPKLFNTRQTFPAIEGWPDAESSPSLPPEPIVADPPVRREAAPIVPPPVAKPTPTQEIPTPTPSPEPAPPGEPNPPSDSETPAPEPAPDVEPVPASEPTPAAPPAPAPAPQPQPAPSSMAPAPVKPDGAAPKQAEDNLVAP